jgi:hypothetical protein
LFTFWLDRRLLLRFYVTLILLLLQQIIEFLITTWNSVFIDQSQLVKTTWKSRKNWDVCLVFFFQLILHFLLLRVIPLIITDVKPFEIVITKFTIIISVVLNVI